MGRNRRKQFAGPSPPPKPMVLHSILDMMDDEGSYSSVITKAAKFGIGAQFQVDLAVELRRAIADIEAVTGRPLLLYVANVIRTDLGSWVAIDQYDDLPFAEMINAEPTAVRDIDILLVTPGGSAQQVSLFVNKLRPRFDTVNFILPSTCMSAGTIWALSGDKIWMDERAYIGPIDPQVQTRDGRWVPAQALQVLLKDIQDKGDLAIKAGRNPDWTHVQILRNIDPREIGNTLSGSNYSIQLASRYLADFKFKNWVTHATTGVAVTPQEKQTRALEVATKLCSHEEWKTHGHGIPRDVAWQQLKLKIEHTESVPGLQRTIRRMWSLLFWVFETTPVAKCYMSQRYALLRSPNQLPVKQP
jgi:Serine dehydrogenase proteinase